MITLMVITFIVGYIFIALEHDVGINKAATAIVLGMTLWVMYMFCGAETISTLNAEHFKHFIEANPDLQNASLVKQCAKFVANCQIVEFLGEHSQIIFYLIGAMTIVELIDVHGGFSIVTNKITTNNKRKLLWILAFITFFMSAVLDNLTTAIVMTMLLRKMVAVKRERWLYAGIVIIAANSGGAWTPTGDVTTIMLWINENVTTMAILKTLFLPSLVSMLIPLLAVTKYLGKGNVEKPAITHKQNASMNVSPKERLSILIIGITAFLCVPIFKAITGLPPFMGVILGMGVIWIYMELLYNRKKDASPSQQLRVQNIIGRIDITTILFFLGILMAVASLQCAGVLAGVSKFLDENVSNVYIINTIIGVLSSIVDNVPLVAGAMGAYDMPTVEAVSAITDVAERTYAMNFIQDGTFWTSLAYCAGVGGSILIIGSAAGVVVMGLEKITFSWYMRNISFLALIGYLAGIAVFALQQAIF